MGLDEIRDRVEGFPLADIPRSGKERLLNPALELYGPDERGVISMIWKQPVSGKMNERVASDRDLLSLKIVSEGLSIERISGENGVPVGLLLSGIYDSEDEGILIPPETLICRSPGSVGSCDQIPDQYLKAGIFTLQWHITNACDLHCKHCYDRGKRSPLTREKGADVLDQMYRFCKRKRVRGHICFSGGNPFLSPHFKDLYSGAVKRGFSTSILGNPVSENDLREIIHIAMPEYFQVSLEGLREHNDTVRGEGFYDRVMAFLDILERNGVSSAVMLTLTADNLDQVLPLGEDLRGKSDYFTFNRLSAVGEGASLGLPGKEEYKAFLERYVTASEENPLLGFKDNLINIVLEERGSSLFGGCTGHGCGAAFNFLALLPDGEVHACRKFPSLLGRLSESSLEDIYGSDIAEMYRRGSSACSDCGIKHVCGGCPAVSSGYNGSAVYAEKDPFCFRAANAQGIK